MEIGDDLERLLFLLVVVQVQVEHDLLQHKTRNHMSNQQTQN
jgi:hypothetical protein